MIRPADLMRDEPLVWSTGSGCDVGDLFEACIAGDLAAVRRLLAKDPSLARCHYRYRKPLYFAVRENRLDVVAFLLDCDPNPIDLVVTDSFIEMAKDRGYAEMQRLLETTFVERHGASVRGETTAAAIRARDPGKLWALLDADPDLLHAGDLRSNRPIHWAVMTRQVDLIDALLHRGADLNHRRADGARPIHLTNGDYHYRGWRDVPKDWPTAPETVYQHLLARGADVDLGMAAATGDLARVRTLLDRDPTLVNRSDYNSYYPGCGAAIKNAAAKGHRDIVAFLLERGADPNLPEEGIAPRGHALYAAATNGHYEIVELLLAHGAHPNAEVESSGDTLSRVISKGDQRLIDLLCSHGAARAVHLLAYYNDLRTAAAVFAVDPSRADDPEALSNAAGEGHEGFVRLMLRYHPDLPRRLDFPSWSVGAKTRELNELLFRHGMDAKARNWLGVTPLHEFARSGDVDKAALFLDHGADLHARDEDICSTPLGWAAKAGRTAMVDCLLQRGAQTNLPDDPPWATPLAWAVRRGHQDVVDRLRMHGAR